MTGIRRNKKQSHIFILDTEKRFNKETKTQQMNNKTKTIDKNND